MDYGIDRPTHRQMFIQTNRQISEYTYGQLSRWTDTDLSINK